MLMVGAVLCIATVAGAVDPAVVGKWEGNVFGAPMDLDIRADGTCTFVDERGKCSTKGKTLTFKGEEGVESYSWSVANNALQLSGGDFQMPVAFRRIGGGAAATTTPQAAPAPSEKATPEKGTRAAVTKEAWGVSFSLPGGWKSADKDGIVMAGSDTEAGVILVRYLPKTTREELLAGYKAGINESGFVAHPVGEASAFESKGGPALAGVLEGPGQDGNPVRVRSVAVMSKYGSAVVVTGLTTVPHYATLSARTDAIARSVSFKAPPKSGPIAGDYQFFYISSNGAYSREAKITLCQSGRFQKSGEMAGSGAAGSAVTSHGNGGTWRSVGDANAGTITLTWGDGTSTTLQYQVSQNPKDRSAFGPALRIGSELYQKTGPGGC